ncbi:MAG: N-acetyltransferase family protein [Acetanaerobacterium sp.]
MDNYILRPATENDIPLILHFILELARYEKREDNVKATVQSLHDALFVKKTAHALIPELNGEPIGYAVYFYNFSTFEGRQGLYVEDVYINPEQRGRGFGKAVFVHLAQLASQNDCARMEWTCLDWNTPSHRFYQSLGASTHPSWIIHRLSGDRLDALAGKTVVSADM